jgi:hypothetical protein
MRLERRQLIIGAAVVVVLGLAAWMWSRPSAPAPRPTAPAQTRARGGRQSANAAVAVGPADPVKLDALKASHDDPGQAGRNPFRFQPKAAPPPIKVAPPVPIEPVGPALPPERTGPPPPPAIPLKFTGSVTRNDGTKWAVLSDGKSAPMFGKDGDIIDGKYLIVKIGAESVEMSYVDGRGRQVIRLTGQ